MRSNQDSHFDFFVDLLPHIHSWALAYPSHAPLELSVLRAGSAPLHTTLSRGAIRTLLSNAFFLNVLPFHDDHADGGASRVENRQFGNISFLGLYRTVHELAVQRLLCFLGYFACARSFEPHELEEVVCYERHTLLDSDLPDWGSLDQKIDVSQINVTPDNMEKSNAKCIMDFANKALHIYKIIPSATQEEILFSTCPEAFPGILFCDILQEREAIIIRNVRRLIEYEGYSSSFRFQGFYSGVKLHNIIVADATDSEHFSRPMIDRDLNKAYLAFMAATRWPLTDPPAPSLEANKISTSHWGCGAFKGDKHLKFLQQVCASTLAGARLDYSTFNDPEMAASFIRLLGLISSRNHTISSIYLAISDYVEEKGIFSEHIFGVLSQ
ncbi:hypothetical protein KP509_16G008700 [Ceratopteris richardii]|nr:hypothetical protein KP509_16G008700 [Ceratopteris richardii]